MEIRLWGMGESSASAGQRPPPSAAIVSGPQRDGELPRGLENFDASHPYPGVTEARRQGSGRSRSRQRASVAGCSWYSCPAAPPRPRGAGAGPCTPGQDRHGAGLDERRGADRRLNSPGKSVRGSRVGAWPLRPGRSANACDLRMCTAPYPTIPPSSVPVPPLLIRRRRECAVVIGDARVGVNSEECDGAPGPGGPTETPPPEIEGSRPRPSAVIGTRHLAMRPPHWPHALRIRGRGRAGRDDR